MRLAPEDLLSVPDEAPEVDRQLHARLTALANLMPQNPQVHLQLHTSHKFHTHLASLGVDDIPDAYEQMSTLKSGIAG